MQSPNRPPCEVHRIKDEQVVPLHVQVVQQREQISLALRAILPLRHEDGLLEGAGRARPVLVLRARVPVIMPDDVPQAPSRRATLLHVVELGRVCLQLPEVRVLLRHEPVVDARELAVGPVQFERPDPGVSGGLGVEDPAEGVRDELAARGSLGAGLVNAGVLGPPEEDVVVGDGEVADDMALLVLVGAGDMAVEACAGLARGG